MYTHIHTHTYLKCGPQTFSSLDLAGVPERMLTPALNEYTFPIPNIKPWNGFPPCFTNQIFTSERSSKACSEPLNVTKPWISGLFLTTTIWWWLYSHRTLHRVTCTQMRTKVRTTVNHYYEKLREQNTWASASHYKMQILKSLQRKLHLLRHIRVVGMNNALNTLVYFQLLHKLSFLAPTYFVCWLQPSSGSYSTIQPPAAYHNLSVNDEAYMH